ncbi:membrane protein [Kocuria dechangensis]|uniref:Membrane protein n=1 Tax=Kocuria dechangensis TaxID=1176249 RepID=A0A917LMH3_9MICC|nr:DUF58 domain-containing protein [Kocuria dechangensis]GGG43148.1 membrane protein [Kocuria dechangensis]
MSRPHARAPQEEGERAEPPVASRARFTGRGWGFLAAGALCLLLATWLGRKDVLALALFLGSAPLFAALSLYLVKPRVQLKRTVDPALVTAGDPAAVRLRVRHRTRRGRPDRGAVTVHETVPGPLGGDRELSVEAGGEPAGYTVRPRRRGVWELGPATVRVADPFGLATELLDVSERTTLHVAPDAVELPEISADRLRDSGADPSRTALPQPGPDNVTTREYRHGDPLRRVHWAASAKQDKLMVRQEEPRSTRRTVLVLDLDERSWPGGRLWAGVLPSTAEFEWAVGLVAALLEHLTQRDTAVHALDGFGRPLPSGGEDDDASAPRHAVAAVTDDTAEDARHGLSRVRPVRAPAPEPGGSGPANPLADRLARDGLVHPLLLVSGDLGREAADRLVRAAPRSAAGSAVLVASAPDREPEGAGVLEAAGWSVVVVPADAAPEEAWARLGTGARTAGAAR